MRISFIKRSMILSAVVLFGALQANAQEFRYKVELDRLIGHREGELIVSDKGLEYRSTKREKESRAWNYDEIKLIEILSPTKLRLWTYKDRKLLLGKDESLSFKIIDARIDDKVSDFLRDRIARPFVTSIVEPGEESVAQIPVKHSHRFGGCEGILMVYPDKLIYESRTGHDSRSWRWTDIRSIGRPDLYQFDVETFEPQVGAASRTFNFVLKEQMDDKTYNLVWSRVYRPTPLIRVSEGGVR